MLEYRDRQSTLLAIALGAATVAYLGWKVSESPEQALQFAFNGASVGAVYALLAMGFTLVYSTVWFFDLYYGAAAAIGAYGVFYLRSQETLGGQYEVNHPALNVAFGVVATGVLWWALHARYHRGLSRRYGARAVTVASGVLSAAVGVYTAVLLTFPTRLEVLLSPVLGVAVALAVVWAVRRGYRGTLGAMAPMPVVAAAAVIGAAAGGYVALFLADAPGAAALPGLGRLVPARGRGRARAIPRALHLHARARAIAADHARRLARCAAGTHGSDHHRVRGDPPPAAGGVRERAVDHRRRDHQGLQRLAIAMAFVGFAGCGCCSGAAPSARPCAPSATTRRSRRSSASTPP